MPTFHVRAADGSLHSPAPLPAKPTRSNPAPEPRPALTGRAARRERAAQGQPVWYLVPDGVVQYITKNNLYGPNPDKPL